MSKYLSQLLGAGEPMFSIALRELEAASGNMSVDVRLTADILAKTHTGMRALGLDPRDTNPKELYHGLLNLVALHDTFLSRRIGADDPTDVADVLRRVKVAAENVHIERKVWAIKHSVMKRLLKAQPPKQVMKALGYRSLDSMLKRESVGALLVGARVAEARGWHEKFLAQYKKLSPLDFEVRDVELLLLDSDKWAALADRFVQMQRHNITHLKELGVVAILPLPIRHMRGITIVAFPQVLNHINEVRLYSAFFRLQQVKAGFGQILMETIINDPADYVSIGGQQIHWRIVRHHFGRMSQDVLPEMFEPHVRAEDLSWRHAAYVLYELEPALHFWHDMEYVGTLYEGQRPISWNLMDMAINYVNNIPYEQAMVLAMRHSLWTELYARYLAQPPFELQVIRQLSADTAALEQASLMNIIGRG